MSLELVKENSSTLVLGLSSDGHLSLDISEFLVPGMHGAKLRCIASNGDSSGQTKHAELKLDIIHGPERVTLTGPGSSRPGTEVELKCSSNPSNPPADLKWEAHDAHDAATALIAVGESNEVWTGTGWETHSSAKVTLPEGGKGLVVRCTAENSRINHNVATQKIVRAHYPPDGVTVEGSSRVAQGETVSLRCTSSPAFPAPSLHWMIRRDGEEEVMETDELNYQEASTDNNGGASVTSDLSFKAGTPGKLEVECYAEHETLGENKKAFIHVIEILEKSLERPESEGGERTKKEETADTRHKSNRDVNEPKEGEVKSASTSRSSQVDQSLMLALILPLLLLCSTLLVRVQTF